MTDEEYIKMQEAALAEHREEMRRYKGRLAFFGGLVAGLLTQLLIRIMEHFA